MLFPEDGGTPRLEPLVFKMSSKGPSTYADGELGRVLANGGSSPVALITREYLRISYDRTSFGRHQFRSAVLYGLLLPNIVLLPMNTELLIPHFILCLFSDVLGR